MNRRQKDSSWSCRNFLYVCGDEPESPANQLSELIFSLRMWRWTDEPKLKEWFVRIFSTYVEMNRCKSETVNQAVDFLYVCGDEPGLKNYYGAFTNIFSTYVEMNRTGSYFGILGFNFLYVCGDEPLSSAAALTAPAFSLRMWRWTGAGEKTCGSSRIFSTYVEMNRADASLSALDWNFLYVCGDEPLLHLLFREKNYR